MHLSLFIPNFRGTYTRYDSINSPQYGSCSFRKRSYSSYSYRYCSFSISERRLMKKPLILREITKYYIADSFYSRKCPKTGLFKFWANNISFGQKTFQIHDGKSEEWVAVEGIFFRRQDFKSFQREAASPVTSCISCHIGNIKKRSIIVQLDCSLRKHIYRHLLHLTTCLSRLS